MTSWFTIWWANFTFWFFSKPDFLLELLQTFFLAIIILLIIKKVK